MAERDTEAVAVLRVAIAAIENAEAQPLDLLGAPVGASRSSEVTRRDVPEEEVRALVEAEVDDLERARRQFEGLGEEQRASRLRHQAEVLRSVLG